MKRSILALAAVALIATATPAYAHEDLQPSATANCNEAIFTIGNIDPSEPVHVTTVVNVTNLPEMSEQHTLYPPSDVVVMPYAFPAGTNTVNLTIKWERRTATFGPFTFNCDKPAPAPAPTPAPAPAPTVTPPAKVEECPMNLRNVYRNGASPRWVKLAIARGCVKPRPRPITCSYVRAHYSPATARVVLNRLNIATGCLPTPNHVPVTG